MDTWGRKRGSGVRICLSEVYRNAKEEMSQQANDQHFGNRVSIKDHGVKVFCSHC